MALAAVQAAMNPEAQSLHPFFSRPAKSQPPAQTDPTSETSDQDYDPTAQTSKTPKKRGRKSGDTKIKKSKDEGGKPQGPLDIFTGLRRGPKNHDSMQDDTQALAADNGEDGPRHKRRKTESPKPARMSSPDTCIHDSAGQGYLIGAGNGEAPVNMAIATEPGSQVAASAKTASMVIDLDVTGDSTEDTMKGPKKVTPRKQMKVTKSGKLVSSPLKSIPDVSSSPRKKRGRKATKVTVSPTVTVIRYGHDLDSKLAIGQRIEDILNSKKKTSKRASAPRKPAGNKTESSKTSHPFFNRQGGKTKEAPTGEIQTEPRVVTPRKSTVTPGKLRAEARMERFSMMRQPAFNRPPVKPRPSKGPGHSEAPWPSQETAHVRNLDNVDQRCMIDPEQLTLQLRARKQKSNTFIIPGDEDIVMKLAKQILPRSGRDIHQSETTPSDTIRLPKRLVTTGVEIQERVRCQVKAQLPVRGAHNCPQNTHPALLALFNGIENNLTPFDEGRCEPQAWNQKFSPISAAHVLQTGKETSLLKDWLHSLTVLSVGSGLSSNALSDIKKPPKKKRKKLEDDFVVSDGDEDEIEEMVECYDDDFQRDPHSTSWRRPRWTRSTNVILLSGPHGCGKSAAVYAVAKELGFEVFEINPGTKRSGKDIQDRVGDMTANHLVNHKRFAPATKDPLATPEDTDNERMSAALQDDLTSGRQGTMTSFFGAGIKKTKEKPKEKPKESLPVKAMSAGQSTLPLGQAKQKSQKQSLILFEEADILFEKDDQFWSQIAKLAVNSKRPIVITCNEERLIPMQDLPLAAFLRLQAPPMDLVSDYLLLLAAREGHLLRREAVENLYESKNHDLRASIADLNFWCQMSVGDKKGGLEWIYQRWPPGSDVDENGRPWRIASEDTYQAGMGFFSSDVFNANTNGISGRDCDLMESLWADWGINPNEGLRGNWSTPSKALDEICAMSEFQSAADVYCCVGLPTYERDFDQMIDSSCPTITDKARANYTLGDRVLQIDHRSDFLSLDTQIYTYTQNLLQREYAHLQDHVHPSSLVPESNCAHAILEARKTKDMDKSSSLIRADFSDAFDTIACPADFIGAERSSYNLIASSFDREFGIITRDLAPYVRSIAAHEQALEAQRLRLSSFLSAGGTGKRSRSTRAARTALEGGVRESKRRDRWFDKEVNLELVMRTAGKEWSGLGSGVGGEGAEEDRTGSLMGTQESGASSAASPAQDVIMQDIRMQDAHDA